MNKKGFELGIDIFDSRLKEYGGFNHFIASKVFRWSLTYLSIFITNKFRFSIIHNNDFFYYDGYHNSIRFGFILISYGT